MTFTGPPSTGIVPVAVTAAMLSARYLDYPPIPSYNDVHPLGPVVLGDPAAVGEHSHETGQSGSVDLPDRTSDHCPMLRGGARALTRLCGIRPRRPIHNLHVGWAGSGGHVRLWNA